MIVLHVDVDQFLVALERRRDPGLAGRPVIVGGTGDPTVPRTVCMCASYEARAAGVRAGTPLRLAHRKLPDAVYLPYDEQSCAAGSAELMTALRELGAVEPLGWEEAFLEPAGSREDPDTSPRVGISLPASRAPGVGESGAVLRELGREVQAHVLGRTGLVCSVGVGETPLQAKTATGFGKPAGVGVLSTATWLDVMGSRPTEALWGIGPRTSATLAERGVTTVGELAAAELPERLAHLVELGRGGARRELVTEPRKPVSRGHQETFPADLVEEAQISDRLRRLTADLARAVLADGHTVAEVGVTVRTATFWQRTKTRRITPATTDPAVIEEAALVALGRFEIHRPVRLLGVRLVFG